MQSSLLLLEVCSPLGRKWLVCAILFEDANERLLRSPANHKCHVCSCDTNEQEGGGPQRRDRSHTDLLMSHIIGNVGNKKNKVYLKIINHLNYDIIRMWVFCYST